MLAASEDRGAMSGSEGRGAPSIDLDVFDDAFLADPYAFHAQLRDAAPVVWLDRYGVYGIARHAEVSAALKDHETFCSGRGVGLADFARETPFRPPSLLLETDPPMHDRTRGIMSKVVSMAAVQKARPFWERRATELIERLVANGRIDGVTELAEVYPLTIFPETVGLMEDGRHNLLDYAALTFNAFGPRNALFQETAKRAETATAWVAEACRRSNLTADGWGMDVFRAADAGLCTEDEAERLVRSLLSAGVDTTINGIGNMLHAFARHPDQWQRLRDDPKLIKRSFEEALRWDSTVQTFFRTVTRDTDISGTVIPEGSKAVLFLASANRDPRRWSDADRFDIGRQASGHVGFGFGIHQCLGQMVARLEAEAVLNALLPRVAEIRLLGEPVRRLNNTLHAMASLPLQFVAA